MTSTALLASGTCSLQTARGQVRGLGPGAPRPPLSTSGRISAGSGPSLARPHLSTARNRSNNTGSEMLGQHRDGREPSRLGASRRGVPKMGYRDAGVHDLECPEHLCTSYMSVLFVPRWL